MPTLRRHDGSQLIIQSYRELLAPDRTSTLKRKIRLLAQRHGNNVWLCKHNDTIEAVFSRESGFLLGETMWLHLEKPQNLIYCEALPEKRQCLVVVVRNNVVFIDTRMSFTNLVDELTSLSATNEQFDIQIWGDLPFAETQEDGKFAFATKNIKSFTRLEDPLLEKLPILDTAQLQPLEMALTSPYLGKAKLVPALVTAGIVIVIIIIWHILHSAATISPETLVPTKPKISPYAAYYRTLESPAPKAQMMEFVAIANMVETAPGWKIKDINYQGNNYSCEITTAKGSIIQLQEWAQLNKLSFSMNSRSSNLRMPSTLPNRPRPNSIYPNQGLVALIVDDLSLIIPRNDISFSAPTSQGPFAITTISIKLGPVSAGTLLMIGDELNNLPVTITQIKMKVGKPSHFSGTIILNVLGD